MKSLLYILQRSCINYFKRLKDKPIKLIGPIFLIIWIIVMFLPRKNSQIVNSKFPIENFVSLFTILMLSLFLYSIYKGAKKPNSKYSMSDVNLVFTAPIKPQTVMVYGLIKQIGVELLASFYFIYQIPNLIRTFNISNKNTFLIIFSLIIYGFLFCNVLTLFIFGLCSKHNNLRGILKNTIKIASLSIVLLSILFIVKMGLGNFIETTSNFITYQNEISFIPILGWMRDIGIMTISKIRISYYLYILLIISIGGVLLYITYNMELDFYEEMIVSAENNQKIQNTKNGEVDRNNGKVLFKARRNVELKLINIYGAKSFFYKHLNEYFKRGFFFFINTYSILLLTSSIVTSVFLKNINIYFLFLGGTILLFFSAGFGGKIYNEIGYHYIFVIPDRKENKLFYGVSSSFIKTFADSIFLFLPFAIISKSNPIVFIFCVITYNSIGIMMSISGVFAYRAAIFLGFTGIIGQNLFFMLFQIVIMILGIIVTGFGTKGFVDFYSYALFTSLITYSLVIGGVFAAFASSLFDNMEL